VSSRSVAQPARRTIVFFWPVVPLAVIVIGAASLASTDGPFLHDTAVTDLVYLLFVLGLYVFVGNSGVFSFGHIAFAAIGAYAAGIFAVPVATKAQLFSSMPSALVHLHSSSLVATLIGGGVAALVGALTSIPLMRLNGLAASLATFSLLIIVHVVAQNLNQVTNGQSAMTGVPTTTTKTQMIVWCLIGIVVAYLFQQSTWGLRLRASREDSVAARASGISVYFERRVAWTLSAFYMGIGGALYGQFLGTFSPDAFYLDITFLIIAMLVIGGTTSLAGAVIGSVFVSVASELLRRVEIGPHIGPLHIPARPGVQAVGLALIMLLILILRPGGITRGHEIHWPLNRLLRTSAMEAAAETGLGRQTHTDVAAD
jgi:branched-chain amino acid transport system permease protein